ncbi:MAG: ABC transporter substrate-binding protein [Anaerolineaceae bacterium]
MTKQILRNLCSLILVSALFLSSCSVLTNQPSANSAFAPLQVSAANCDYGGEIQSVQAVDEFTVRFTLCSPDAAFPSKIGSPIFAIQDQAFLNGRQGDSNLLTEVTNGTGPYKLLSNSPVGNIQLQLSPSYWGIPPATQFLDFKFQSKPGEGPTIGELASSSAMSAYELTDVLKVAMNDTVKYKVASNKPLNLVYLGFSNKVKPMDNLAVRKAIATMLDRTKLTQSFLSVGSEVATQMIPLDVTPGHSSFLNWYDLNLQDAQDLLQSANFDFNQELTLAYVGDGSDLISLPNSLALEIQSELAASNIKVILKPMAQADFDKSLAEGSQMMFLNSFKALYPDGEAFYELPFIRNGNQFGDVYPSIVQGFKEVQSEQQNAARQQKFDLLNQQLKELVPLVPIGSVPKWSFFHENVVSTSVNGYFINLEDITNRTNSIIVVEANRPLSLWPADETDYDTFQITRLVYDTLVSYDFGTQALKPDLADSWESNANGTEWTFALRYGVKFSDGASLDANDVVASFAAIWDAKDVNHKGRTGEFTLYQELFGPLLNAQ